MKLNDLPMSAMVAALIAGGRLRMFNNAPTVEELQDKLLQLNESSQGIQARADAENRPLTLDEEKEVEQIFATFELTEQEIARRQKQASMAAKLAPRAPSQEESGQTNAQAAAQRPAPQPQSQPRQPHAQPLSEDRGKWGFRSFGEFARAVMVASAKGGVTDPRLIANAPTASGSEGVGADGGFAVPPDFRQEIMQKVFGEQSLIGMTDQQISSSNSFSFPKDETTPWQTSGGVQAYWEGEASQKTQSKPALLQETVKLNKLYAFVNLTDDLLEDAPAMANYLRKKAPEKIDFKISDALINGTGAGMPLGLLASPALVTVNPESGQAAATLRFENVVNMYSRLYAPCRSKAVWLVNQDIEPQLLKMQFPGTGTAVPTYLPPGGLSASPYGTLMGRPIIPTQACPALGTVGDIILADMSQYLTITKAGGVRMDVSIHLFFDYDTTSFRFVLRIGGQPWWSSAISGFQAGVATKSFAVALGTRA